MASVGSARNERAEYKDAVNANDGMEELREHGAHGKNAVMKIGWRNDR